MAWLELKIPPLVQALGCAAGMWLSHRALSPAVVPSPWRLPVAIGFLMAGVVLAVLSISQFRAARTTIDPRDPEATSALVSFGVYRWSRNPMYVAMLLGLIGWGIYLGHLPGLFPLPVFVLFVNRFQIGPEERALRSRFGMSYAEYTATVRRWL